MPVEQVCQGLDEAVQTMKVHEVADITVQPQLGYGSSKAALLWNLKHAGSHRVNLKQMIHACRAGVSGLG